MDQMRPTPRNALMGLISDKLNALHDILSSGPKGFSNPGEMLANALGLRDIAATADRMSYGLPITSGAGYATQMLPETRNALLTIAPMAMPAKAAAPAVKAAALRGAENLAAPVAAGPAAAQRGAIVYHGSPDASAALSLTDQGNVLQPVVNASELKDALLKRYKELSTADPYRHYGVRVIGPDQQVQVGSKLTRSSKWVDGKPLTTKLPGTAVFELRQSYDNAERAIDKALSYNLGTKGQKIALVYGDSLGKNTMPEAFSALIKSPVIDSLFDRPEELAKVSRVEELRRILGK